MFVNPHITLQLLAEQQHDSLNRADRGLVPTQPSRRRRVRRRLHLRAGMRTRKSMPAPSN
jgi:hypothetical protein